MVKKMILSVCCLIFLGCRSASAVLTKERIPPSPISASGYQTVTPSDIRSGERVKAEVTPLEDTAPATPTPHLESNATHNLKIPAQPKSTEPTVIELVRTDLAGRLGISIEEISLTNIAADEAPAGNLGCPAGGTPPPAMDAVIVVKVILLKAQGKEYIYHTRGLDFAYCGQVIRPGE